MKVTITTYAELVEVVQAFRGGHFNLLFIEGDAGHCKSTIVRAEMGDAAVWLRGCVSAFRLYTDLFQNLDRPFVLDDVDQLWTDRDLVRIMKELCEADEIRGVSWNTHSVQLVARMIPQSFETLSRVVVINNRWHQISPVVASMVDRGLLVHFRPSFDEVLRYGKRWFFDREILGYVEQHRDLIETLSLRALVVALEAKQAGLAKLWRRALWEELGLGPASLVAELMDDPGYPCDEDRILRFSEQTGQSRAQWYLLKRMIVRRRDEHAASGRTGPAAARRAAPRRGGLPRVADGT